MVHGLVDVPKPFSDCFETGNAQMLSWVRDTQGPKLKDREIAEVRSGIFPQKLTFSGFDVESEEMLQRSFLSCSVAQILSRC